MTAFTPPPTRPPTRKHSLNFILSPPNVAISAPDVPGVQSPTGSAGASKMTTPPPGHRRSELGSMPPAILTRIAYHVVVNDAGKAGRPALLLPLLHTNRAIYAALNFENNPILYNRLFRATFDLGALIRRTQWMFDVNTDVPGTSRKTELFGNPRSWAIEYKDRWKLRNTMRAQCRYSNLDVPGLARREDVGAMKWCLWFLWTENDCKNLQFLTEECLFHEWIMVQYKDEIVADSLIGGTAMDNGPMALGSWLVLISGTDLFGERNPAEIDDKIYCLRPSVFSPKYEILYADWRHRRLPLCKKGCEEHPAIVNSASAYSRFGHQHKRAPPHLALGMYLIFFRLLQRHPSRIGLKAGSTVFNGESWPGLFSPTHIIPSLYHDNEWQRNTACQDAHTSFGLPPLTFLGRMQGFWRGNLLFYDFEAYRQLQAGHQHAVYTGTFSQHAVEVELKETVIRVPIDEVGGKGSLLHAGFNDDESDEELKRIRQGYGYEVLKGDAINSPEPAGYTKEILLSGTLRSSWGSSAVKGRVRAWDGLVTISIGAARQYPCGSWVWRGYLYTGGYFIGRWRDTYTPVDRTGYEGPLGMVRAGDIMYPPNFPTSMATSAGVTALEVSESGTVPGPVPGRPGVIHAAPQTTTPGESASSASSDAPIEGPRGKRRAHSLEDEEMRPRSRGRKGSGSARR